MAAVKTLVFVCRPIRGLICWSMPRTVTIPHCARKEAALSVARPDPARPILAPFRGGALGGALPVIGHDAERHLPGIGGLAALEHRVAGMRRAHFHGVRHRLAVAVGGKPDAARIDDEAPIIER